MTSPDDMDARDRDAPAAKPAWIRARLGHGPRFKRLHDLVAAENLHTVCSEAMCPNRGECWEKGRATLMILGEACSRQCTFCGVKHAWTGTIDEDEPRRAAQAVRKMGLNDVVITSVTRDDLPDGGAAVWAETVHEIKRLPMDVVIEVLVPDFGGNPEHVATVIAARPDVWGHNLETVPRLYETVRPQADYERSLAVLRQGAGAGLVAKTSIMVGLGETLDEIRAVMRDARDAGCRIVYIGQYLQPTRAHHPVTRYVEPQEFDAMADEARQLGFDCVVSAPLVRSSYHSDNQARFLASLRIGAVTGEPAS